MKNNIKWIAVIIFVMGLVMVFAPVTSAAMLGERTLTVGTVGEDVKLLQAALNRIGLKAGAIDGVYGKMTEQAVKALEMKQELSVDGIADQEVFELLQEKTTVFRGQAPGRYKELHDIVATAYAPGPHDNGKWGNLTHMGTTVRPGIIAVDPRLIPLGTRVYIEYSDGHGAFATAEDTGGAIKGNRIDIAMNTVKEAYNFGIQKVKVYVLE